MRNNLKLFAQTCDRFELPDRAASSALSSASLRNYELVAPEKTKSAVSCLNNGKHFRTLIVSCPQNQCQVYTLILKRNPF